MASIKCPDCGAALTDDSKFCKYCGAKIDDGVKRFEINVNKRIEDVADVRRVSYEERESDLRIKRMQREIRQQKAKRITYFVLLALSVLVFLLGAFGEDKGGLIILGTGGTMAVLIGIVTQLISGKW